MFESIYVGLTGLSTFARNLSVIGNNVSNINTPGFKASQLMFSDLVYRNAISQGTDGSPASLQLGAGVGTSGSRVLFKQGTLNQTGRDTDLGIDGSGFFVLRADGKTTYTRAGGFTFDADGFLTAPNGARVAGFDGGLTDVSTAALRTVPPVATSTIRVLDNLSVGDDGTTAGSDGKQDISVSVFDAAGGSHPLTLHFVNNSGAVPGEWTVQVQAPAGVTIGNPTGVVHFNANLPVPGFTSLSFTLNAPGVTPTTITLDMSGLTNFSAGADSTAKLGSQDGHAPGSLTKVAFDANGLLTATYSDGETRTGARLALAFFGSPGDLEQVGGGIFDNRSGQRVIIGNPRTGVFGAIAPQSLESANVDLAEQFSELIVSQRGYQASSQVISTANDMIQQLFDIKSKR
jgi:flagellar hook protein FlgE